MRITSGKDRLRCSVAVALLFGLSAGVEGQTAERTDYLTFAQGARVAALGGDCETLRVGLGDALEVIDGNPGKFALTQKLATEASLIELVFELPALTTFDRFAVTDVLETPSPSQTFVGRVMIAGSAESAGGGFVELAVGELEEHDAPGEVTELEIVGSPAVRWVRLSLTGALDSAPESYFLEFSEVIGNGRQESVQLDERFGGVWRHRANVLELKQQGATVTGCYDGAGELQGTVTGNVLRATGIGRDDGVPSAFVLTVSPKGEIQGVRSSNGGPFRDYSLGIAPSGTVTDCSEKEVVRLGCGSIIHGIQFGFDSAEIRPESEPVLADLYAGLQESEGTAISVVGHTSSEGSQAYNQVLSERRAQAVVDDLTRRGLAAAGIRASGRGESEPIANNDSEAGRSLNRRVEIVCAKAR